ncbi:MAG: hypothetical protein M9933_15390 [Chitinophagaceae bacterium]|nr:hypothetical protein [Chitinophagaceae bacterium]
MGTHAVISRKWFLAGIVNLSLVALLGTVMRYKIAFDLPLFVQNNLLHAHSHFAFSGWISHILFTALAILISPFISRVRQKKYFWLIVANLVSAYGMLIAFSMQGYRAVSITFSTLSLLVGVSYAYVFIKDSRYLPRNDIAKPWAIAGLLFNVISVAGPFTLAYLMASKSNSREMTLASIHYFLHFQYNGWFFFGGMALITTLLPKKFLNLKWYFVLFTLTVIPTFFQSVLWIKLPAWLRFVTAVATLVQLTAWLVLVARSWPLVHRCRSDRHSWMRLFLFTAATAMTLKLVLQALSMIPSLGQMLFDYRPIIIFYLHLVLLGVFSLFIIYYCFRTGQLQPTRIAKKATIGFFAGVVLNELVLGVQGIASIALFPVPFVNEMLFCAAFLLLTSAVTLVISQLKTGPGREMSVSQSFIFKLSRKEALPAHAN